MNAVFINREDLFEHDNFSGRLNLLKWSLNILLEKTQYEVDVKEEVNPNFVEEGKQIKIELKMRIE